MAQVKISNTYDLLAVAKAAGQADSSKVRYKGDTLHVDGVSRSALDQAVLAADALAALRMQKKAEMKLAFAAAIAAGFVCTLPNLSITLDADMNDILRLDGAARLAVNAGAVDATIRDAANATHTLLLADLQTAVDQLGANYQTLLARKWAADASISSPTITSAQLAAVAW